MSFTSRIAIILQVVGLICGLFFGAWPATGNAQEGYQEPANRFWRKSPDSPNYAHWNEIRYLASGATEASQSETSYFSQLHYFAQAAGTEVVRLSVTDPTQENDANYLVIFRPGPVNSPEHARQVTIAEMPNRLSPKLEELANGQLNALGQNCFGAVAVNEDNQIEAFVAVVGSSESSKAGNACGNALIPLSLGVLPMVSFYQVTLGNGRNFDFLDFGETLTAMLAIGLCRERFDYNITCPVGVTLTIRDASNNLAK